MHVLALLVLSQTPSTQGDTLQRMTRFLKETDTLSVDVRINSTLTIGTATITFDKPNRMRIDMEMPGEKYSFRVNEAGGIDFDPQTSLFDEMARAEALKVPESRVSDLLLRVFPPALLKLFTLEVPIEAFEFKPAGQAEVGGVKVDKLQAPAHSAGLVLYVDSQGRILRADTPTRTLNYTFHNYKEGQSISDEVFTTEPPVGYTALTVPGYFKPPFPEDEVLLGSWADASGKLVNLTAEQRGVMLVFITEPGCNPSDGLRPHIEALAADLKVRVVEISLGKPSHSSSLPTYHGAAAAAERLSVICTPSVYLLEGRVFSQMWYGYDSKIIEAVIADIKAATTAAIKAGDSND